MASVFSWVSLMFQGTRERLHFGVTSWFTEFNVETALGIPLLLKSLVPRKADRFLSTTQSECQSPFDLSCPPHFSWQTPCLCVLLSPCHWVGSSLTCFPGWDLSFKGQSCLFDSVLHRLVGHFTSSYDVTKPSGVLGGVYRAGEAGEAHR